MTKPALDSLLYHFCLVKTRNILLRLSSFLDPTVDPIVPLLFSIQLLRLSALNFSYRKKKCRLKHLGKKLHLPSLHDTSKIKDYEQRNSTAFQEVLLSTISCGTCFNWCNACILISTFC